MVVLVRTPRYRLAKQEWLRLRGTGLSRPTGVVRLDLFFLERGGTYNVSNEECLRSVAVVAIEIDGDVDIDDVAIFQRATKTA